MQANWWKTLQQITNIDNGHTFRYGELSVIVYNANGKEVAKLKVEKYKKKRKRVVLSMKSEKKIAWARVKVSMPSLRLRSATTEWQWKKAGPRSRAEKKRNRKNQQQQSVNSLTVNGTTTTAAISKWMLCCWAETMWTPQTCLVRRTSMQKIIAFVGKFCGEARNNKTKRN